jgi:hypothetical protein
LNQWHHVVAVWTGKCGVSGSVKFYIDGVLQSGNGSDDWGAGSPTIDGGGNNDYEISSDSSDTYFWDGMLDDIRLYDRMLSTDEIKRLYKMGSTLKQGAPNSTGSLSNGLVGWWTFDGNDSATNNSGILTVLDRSGSGNKGTTASKAATPSFTPGKIGQALNFDGVDDVIAAGDIAATDGASQLTASAWVYSSVLAAGAPAVTKWTNSNNNWALYTSESGDGGSNDISFTVDGTNDGYTTGNIHKAGVWEHWVGVFDGTQTGDSARLKIYFNGEAQSLTFNGTIPATTNSNSAAVSIGIDPDPFTKWTGLIDDVRIYTRALSADEVKRLYTMGR